MGTQLLLLEWDGWNQVGGTIGPDGLNILWLGYMVILGSGLGWLPTVVAEWCLEESWAPVGFQERLQMGCHSLCIWGLMDPCSQMSWGAGDTPLALKTEYHFQLCSLA